MSNQRFNHVQLSGYANSIPPGASTQIGPDGVQKNGSSEEQLPLWPSERIPPGGLFHTPKVQYSKETSDLIRLLVKESKMSMLMRKRIDETLRNGDPLPLPQPPRPNTSNDPDKETLAILERARNAKRKSLKNIMASGAFNQSYYRPPTDNRMPIDKAKAQLQLKMAGTVLPDPAIKPKRRPREEAQVSEEDIINELLDQINERANWLAEMEEIGQGKKYRAEIRDQISERLHRIRALETKAKLKASGCFRFVD
ncbi:UPF0193 protein EVG1 homolog [Scaptodrosophila lebanonensis]|uniref:UPF0193 protein EVG1 homolog n=1 Tax=Drosophila lebanonensis TaxID=7225 RepID=A0A6J2T837_DROLE|nr:UPF0193 protein EVG1 homolog [Scaptodrosophila lebanonensis]